MLVLSSSQFDPTTWDHPANGRPGLQDIELVEVSQEVLERSNLS